MAENNDNDEMLALVRGINRDMTDDEVIRVIKYVMKNLPTYNKRKGTNAAMEMILKMFSLSCDIVNLWHRKDIDPKNKNKESNDKYGDFLEEPGMTKEDFITNYLTSRFNVEVFYSNLNFVDFTKNVELFVKLIDSIKPVTRILNQIKYIILEQNDYYFYDIIQNIENELSQRTITITDANHGIDSFFIYDPSGKLFIPYKGSDEGNIYMLMMNFVNSKNANYKIEVKNKLKESNLSIIIDDGQYTINNLSTKINMSKYTDFAGIINNIKKSFLNKQVNIEFTKTNSKITKTDSGIYIEGLSDKKTSTTLANYYVSVIPRLYDELKKILPNSEITVKCTEFENPTYIKLTINHAKNTTIFGAIQ